MKLSIIVPVYNVQQYIKQCMESIYTKNIQDFEVICIDDKGTDKSIEIVKEYIKNKSITNLNIIEHHKNMGLSEARNTGIKNANGKYICFLDSDDLIIAEGLNKLVIHAEENDLDVVEGKLIERKETDCPIEIGNNYKQIKPTDIISGDEFFKNECECGQYAPMACCRIFKTDFLKKNNCYFVPNISFEDEIFSSKAIILADKVQYVEVPFYIYRRREGSITTNMFKNDKWYKSYIRIIKELTMFSNDIYNKKSYRLLKDRIAQITLSILKNPVAYGATKEQIENIIIEVKSKKLYKIPIKSKNLLIKVQGYLMRFPRLFVIIYTILGRKTNEKN